MRLIDTDALIKSVPDAEPDIFENCQRCKLLDREQVVELIEKQYLIDAVEVVRCKDCVHYKGYWYCDAWNNSPGFPAVTEDGFCNMAERRTDETD